MKTQIFKITMAVLCTLIVSCNDTMEELNLDNSVKNNVEYHGVPLEEALAHLDGFLASLEEPTRSGSTRRVGSVNVVRSRDVATRSVASAAENVDSLIYVVNFEDNQGFAYLAADDRISEPVIYVADSGSISTNGLGSFGPLPLVNPRPIYTGYPLDGPGTFFDNEFSDGELFMNPNTFNFYNGNANDYYAGDFFLNGETDYLNMISQVNDYVFNYVEFEIDPETGGSIYQEIEYEGDPEDDITETRTTTFVVEDTIVNNLLTFAKNWRQGAPLNMYCPTVKKYLLFGSERQAYVGCVPLAIAKIMAYHGYPSSYSIDGVSINWFTVKNFTYTYGKTATAKLLRHIGESSGAIYFYEGTFTLPSLAANYLRNRNYSGINYRDYNHDIVINMLENNCPVFVCSIPTDGIWCSFDKSHAWNIDGYMKQTVTKRKDYYINDMLYDTDEDVSYNTFVHCDFGWEGYCNGYFISGVFNLASKDVQYDTPEHKGTKDTNYNWYLKIIQYNKPQ